MAHPVPELSFPIEWLFIDIGGVLFDDEPLLHDFYRFIGNALNAAGVCVSEEAIEKQRQSFIRSQTPAVHKATLRHFAPDNHTANAILEEFRKWLEPQQSSLNPMFPGIPETLAILAKNYKLAIAANQGAYVREILKERGLYHYFSGFGISGEMNLAKPDPNFFTTILNRLQTTVDKSVMIGDSIPNDLLPAISLGMRTVRVLSNGNNINKSINCSNFSGTIESLNDLPELLNLWNRA